MPLDYAHDLNDAQLQAVLTTEGPVLVIAGAGSGKTRTIVYRLARLVEQGVDPSAILLLTFTRKAALEMLSRAEKLAGTGLAHVQGGTFHAFAFSVLRRFPQAFGFPGGATLLDRADAEDVMGQVLTETGLGKGDKSFPKKGHVLELAGKARNKELSLQEVLARESYHLLPHAEALERLAQAYQEHKTAHGLIDYDDLLFHLERAFLEQPDLLEYLRLRHRYLMVDEYQDTNRVQARLVKHLAGEAGNVLAVGDDAQSIYAFRGANVENILAFPKQYPGTRVIRLEENYRSTQPILDLTNAILRQAEEKFDKTLFSRRLEGPLPELFKAFSDQTQAKLVVETIRRLRRDYLPCEIAVLFRAGYQSYPLELTLNKEGIAFQKYGGMRFAEASHVKDVVAHLRVVHNPRDTVSWRRVLTLVDRVGDKTAARIAQAVRDGDRETLASHRRRNPGVDALLAFLEDLRQDPGGPSALLERVVVRYTPVLAGLHPEDYPRRLTGLEQLVQIGASYTHLESFLADMALESPEEDRKTPREDAVVLSTVHSAKGLEWPAVLVIDLVDERFPSRHALARPEDLEEERRLFYVAATRAKDYLGLFVPGSVFNRASGCLQPAMPSLLVRDLPRNLFTEHRETFLGGVSLADPVPAARPREEFPSSPVTPAQPPRPMGFCRHRIFGRGKVVAWLEEGKCRVNFPGFGLKVILSEYLEMEP